MKNGKEWKQHLGYKINSVEILHKKTSRQQEKGKDWKKERKPAAAQGKS